MSVIDDLVPSAPLILSLFTEITRLGGKGVGVFGRMLSAQTPHSLPSTGVVLVQLLLMLPELKLKDRLRLRKLHPCGNDIWEVVRLGADIKIVCLGCGRHVMLSRRKLARRVKEILPPSSEEGGIQK